MLMSFDLGLKVLQYDIPLDQFWWLPMAADLALKKTSDTHSYLLQVFKTKKIRIASCIPSTSFPFREIKFFRLYY